MPLLLGVVFLSLPFVQSASYSLPSFPYYEGNVNCSGMRMPKIYNISCIKGDFTALLASPHFTESFGDTYDSNILEYIAGDWFLTNMTYMREVEYTVNMTKKFELKELQIMHNYTDGFALKTFTAFTTPSSAYVIEAKWCGKAAHSGNQLYFSQDHIPAPLSDHYTVQQVERYLRTLPDKLASLVEGYCANRGSNATDTSVKISFNTSPIFEDSFISPGEPLDYVKAFLDDGQMVSVTSILKQYAYLASFEECQNETVIYYPAEPNFFNLYTLLIFLMVGMVAILLVCCCACCIIICCNSKRANFELHGDKDVPNV